MDSSSELQSAIDELLSRIRDARRFAADNKPMLAEHTLERIELQALRVQEAAKSQAVPVEITAREQWLLTDVSSLTRETIPTNQYDELRTLARRLFALLAARPDTYSESQVQQLLAAHDQNSNERLREMWGQAISALRATPILSDDIVEVPQGGTLAEYQLPFTAAGFKELAIKKLEAARDAQEGGRDE